MLNNDVKKGLNSIIVVHLCLYNCGFLIGFTEWGFIFNHFHQSGSYVSGMGRINLSPGMVPLSRINLDYPLVVNKFGILVIHVAGLVEGKIYRKPLVFPQLGRSRGFLSNKPLKNRSSSLVNMNGNGSGKHLVFMGCICW